MENSEDIRSRIETKKADYERYDFTDTEDTAFKTFFDLAQEFDDIREFYRLCTEIPASFFGLETSLYLLDPVEGGLAVASSAPEGMVADVSRITVSEYPFCTGMRTLVLPIRGKKILMDRRQLKARTDVLGFLEVAPATGIEGHRLLFFEKYANRIGFNMHNKFLVERNIEHLKFIRSLVADIEHNIIAPNMVYKLLLRNLKNKIVKNQQIEVLLSEYLADVGEPRREDIRHFQMELNEVNQGLREELSAIEKHYQNMSLFLETLLRRGHFDQGRLILRTQMCNMKKEVLEPQLEQFVDRFRRMGIGIDDRISGIPDEEVISVADVGLLAQVYANLFSNALKYTREVVAHGGEKLKYVSYGREVIMDFFGPGRDGIKYNVFSTGPHIGPDEQGKIFEEGYRGSDVRDRPGTGHGLSFIKNVIELHNGVVGYEPTQYGNNFYFILPKK